jgi:predicted permease
LLDGREFSAGDREDTPPVVVVNATLARRYWPGQNPLGRKVRVDGKWREVAGVARDIKYLYLDEAPEPYLYLPLVQSFWPQVTLHIRAAEEGALRAQTVQQELRRLDPNLPVFDVRTMRDNMAFSLLGYSISTSLLGGTGLLGLVLAAIGTFGLVSYSVTQRRREIGVRLALGAQRRDIERLVTGEGARLAALGIVLGLAGSALATRWLSALLYGVSPIDPATFAAAALFLGGVALLASYLPARRASAVDPVQALRCE